jgi:hypothetical protein
MHYFINGKLITAEHAWKDDTNLAGDLRQMITAVGRL